MTNLLRRFSLQVPQEHGFIMIWSIGMILSLGFMIRHGISILGLVISMVLGFYVLFSETWVLEMLQSRFRKIPWLGVTGLVLLSAILIVTRYSWYLVMAILHLTTFLLFFILASFRTKKRTSDQLVTGAAVLGLFPLIVMVSSIQDMNTIVFARIVFYSYAFMFYSVCQVIFVDSMRKRVPPFTPLITWLLGAGLLTWIALTSPHIGAFVTLAFIIPIPAYFWQAIRKASFKNGDRTFKSVGLEITFELLFFTIVLLVTAFL